MNLTETMKHRAYAFPREFLVPSRIKQELMKNGVELPEIQKAIQDGISLAAIELWKNAEKNRKKQSLFVGLFYVGAAVPPFIELPFNIYRYLPLVLMAIGTSYYILTEQINRLLSDREILITARLLYDESEKS